MMKKSTFSTIVYLALTILLLANVSKAVSCTVPTNLTLNYTFTTAVAGETVEVTWTSDCPNAMMTICIINVDMWQTLHCYTNIPNTGSYMFTINTGIPLGESLFYIEDIDKNTWNYGPYFDLLGPLPVELSDFNIDPSASGKEVTVSFKTASESNVSHFEIQHSPDGYNFKEIGILEAVGTSDTEQTYQFTHPSPNAGENYYRIKMVDRDGTFKYSSIKSVYIDAYDQIDIFPNPGNGIFQIEGVSGHAAKAKVIDNFGKLVSELPVLETTLDLSGLPNGIYFIVLSVDNQIVTRQIIKND